MKRKYILGIITFSIIAILGVGLVAASPFNFGDKDLSDGEKEEMKEQMEAMQTAIENGDYETWKSLMEERIAKMQEQITEENFNNIVEMHQQEEERRAEMEEQREQFCEENDCPNFEDMELPENFEGHGMKMGFKGPLTEGSSNSE